MSSTSETDSGPDTPPGVDVAPPGVDVALPGVDIAPPGVDVAPSGVDVAPPGVDVEDATISIVNITLDSQPSCLEFSCRDPEYFVVGTYVLEAQENSEPNGSETSLQDEVSRPKQTRKGSLMLFRLQGHILSCVQTIVTAFAILDLHFSKNDDTALAVATSEGSVCIYRLILANEASLVEESVVKLFDPSILVLSLAWYPKFETPVGERSSIIAVSSSDGQVAVFDSMRHIEDSQAQSLGKSQGHSFEAWAVAWSVKNWEAESHLAVLYSGGDDSILCRHSSFGRPLEAEGPMGDEAQHFHEPSFRDVTTHIGGVTAILPLSLSTPEEDDLLITGSYDEYVRILTLSNFRRQARVLAKKQLGGGVWRLKLLDSMYILGQGIHLLVLASCMHAGARLLKIARSEDRTHWSINVIAKFEEHESMNYASDGRIESPDGERSSGYTCVSTSFYDRKLCVWTVEHPEGMNRKNPIKR